MIGNQWSFLRTPEIWSNFFCACDYSGSMILNQLQEIQFGSLVSIYGPVSKLFKLSSLQVMKAWVSVVALSSVRQDLILLSDRRLMLQDLQMFLICSSMLNPLSSTAPIVRTDELAEITESPMVILMSDVIFLSCAGWPMTRNPVITQQIMNGLWRIVTKSYGGIRRGKIF